MSRYTDYLDSLEAIRRRRVDRETEYKFLDDIAALVYAARHELSDSLDRYDERVAKRKPSDSELDRQLDCMARARDMKKEQS